MKIFLLIMFISIPNAPSVKYNALLYPTELECINALDNYIRVYESKDLIYKNNLKTTAFCLPFNSFPIPGIIKKTDA